MSGSAVTFSILIKQTKEYGFVAHCLELDLVATADTLDAVKADILDVIDISVLDPQHFVAIVIDRYDAS